MGTHDLAAFTQWECEMVVYRADDDGLATAEIEYIGGCENRLDIEQGYAEERADRSGDPFARNQHLEEAHVIQLESLWLSRYRQQSGEEGYRTPRLGRGQRFVVVMLWTDEDSGIWHKRTYYGVQINPLSFDSQAEYFAQRATMHAGYYVPSNGQSPAVIPTLEPDAFGTVRYVTAAGSFDLLTYNFTEHEYAALSNPAGRIDMPGAGSGYLFRLLVGGTLALAVDTGGNLLVKSVIATGGSFATGYPRAEFFNGNLRFATVTQAGVLAVPNFLESPANPALALDFEFRNGANWLASLGVLGAFAPSIRDTL